MMQSLEEMFAQLGQPEHVNCAFAITLKSIEAHDLATKDGKLRMEKLPRPDYEHRIYRCFRSDNYIVTRPDKDGNYPGMQTMERVR